MDVDCEGCAGCCIDWRDVAPDGVDLGHERRGGLVPLDDAYNLVPLSSDEVRAFVRGGQGDAMTPRLFESGERSVTVDGHDLAAVDGRPAFFVGLRRPPKPVGPFESDAAWLPTCVFLDPATLQCRIHDGDRYPDTCARYPADNLALGVETECERVEAAFGGERLLEADGVDSDPLLGVGALGATVFAHPESERLAGRVERIASGDPTPADRAEFVGVAAASRPGALDVDGERYEAARRATLEADSWVGRAIESWERLADGEPADPSLAERVEERRGAPETPGWE
jgi:Fe-S-cluster containining protein